MDGTPPYNGNILIPSRVMKAARNAVIKADKRQSELPDSQELEALLEFLGYVVLGVKVLFDGSVPSDFRGDKSNSSINTSEFDVHIDPLESCPISDDYLCELTRDAAYRFAENYDSAIKKPVLVGRPIDEKKVDSFFTLADILAKETDTAKRTAHALYASGNNVMGAKFLLGLSVAEQDNALQRIATIPNTLQEASLSTLSTRFRGYLLANWAPRKGALYAALPEQTQALESYQQSLIQELKTKRPGANPISQTLKVLPLIGAWVVLDSPSGTCPRNLFEQARNLGEEWKFRRIQKSLIRHQIIANKKGIESVLEELEFEVNERIQSHFKPKNFGYMTASHTISELIKFGVATAKPEFSPFIPMIEGGVGRAFEPDRLISFISASIMMTSSSQNELTAKVKEIWE